MNNNEWIKYSERKPEKSGAYIVVNHNAVDMLLYVIQSDIDEYTELENQLNALFSRRMDVYKNQSSEFNDEQLMVIEKEIDLLIEKRDAMPFYDIFYGDIDVVEEEGFYKWGAGYEGDGSWFKQLIEFWQPLPELPKE